MSRTVALILGLLTASTIHADDSSKKRRNTIEPASVITSAKQSAKKLSLFLGYGFGQSSENSFLLEGGFIFEIDPAVEFMYEKLDIEFTDNFMPLTLTATYSLGKKIGVYGIIPAGIVQTRSEGPLGGIDFGEDFNAGVGDITAGIYYRLAQESPRRPYISISLDANTDTAKHSSLGDGLRGYTLGLYLRKRIGRSVYAAGSTYYTLQAKSNGIEPGGITGVSGGIGFATRGITNEVRLSYSDIRPIDYRGFPLVPRDDNLALIVSSRGLQSSRSRLARTEYRLYINNLSEGLELDESSFGFTMVTPLRR